MTYSQVIRIVPEACLPWHGRTTPQSARLAGAPAVSFDEGRRDAAHANGELVSRGASRSAAAPPSEASQTRSFGSRLARALADLDGWRRLGGWPGAVRA